MEIAATVALQVTIMLILIGVGFILAKYKFINEVGAKQMTTVLLSVVTPCVLRLRRVEPCMP